MKMNNNKYSRESFLPCLESDLNGEYKIGRVCFKHEHRLALPLSIAITKHGFSQLPRLHLQLLNLLQQSFMVGMLGPVPQRKDKKKNKKGM